MKHLSFVQPRFESFVGPRRKFICLIQAIIMLMCSIAGDPRVKKPRRDRADAALEALTPEDIVACGLAADFGEVCLSFLRIFDVSFHDPARTLREKREFVHALKVLFLQGHILAAIPPEARVQSFSGGVITAKTLTQIAVEQCAEKRTFYYGSKVKVLWGRNAAADAKEALTHLQDAVEQTIERIGTDLNERDLMNRLECFDLEQWQEAKRLLRGSEAEKGGGAENQQPLAQGARCPFRQAGRPAGRSPVAAHGGPQDRASRLEAHGPGAVRGRRVRPPRRCRRVRAVPGRAFRGSRGPGPGRRATPSPGRRARPGCRRDRPGPSPSPGRRA